MHEIINNSQLPATNFNCGIKSFNMAPLTVKELQSESEKLKQRLGSMIDENVSLKYRLSEVLKAHFDKKMLLEVEGYQNYFVREDELIGLLRNDIAVLEKLMKVSLIEGNEISPIDRKLKQLRCNILSVERQFKTLKAEFVSYLVRNKLTWKE